jgi:DNA ligase-4
MPFDHIRRHVTRSGVYIGSHNDPRPSPCSHLMVLLFDILLIDDNSLLNYPFSERISRLDRVLVSPKRGYCEIVDSIQLDFSEGERTAARLKRYFSRGIRDRWEGFILKAHDAPYFNLLGDRPDKTTRGHGFWSPNDCAWIKLKKDYITGLGDSADFAVVGGVAECGRTHAMGLAVGDLNTFHIAVLTNKRDVEKYGVKPRLKVIFEVTYSITRSDLDYIQRCAYFDAVKYEVFHQSPRCFQLIRSNHQLFVNSPT